MNYIEKIAIVIIAICFAGLIACERGILPLYIEAIISLFIGGMGAMILVFRMECQKIEDEAWDE